MLKPSELREYEILRLDLQIALEVGMRKKAQADVKRLDASIKDLRARRASVLANEVPIDLNEVADINRYDQADILFLATLQRQSLRKALRQLFEDSAPDPYERDLIFSLVTAVIPDAKEATVYSTLSRLVAEGIVEKDKNGYRGKSK